MKIKVFNPQLQIDVFVDWFGYNFENKRFTDTEIIEEIYNQPVKIACLPIFFDQYQKFKDKPFDLNIFDLILLTDVEAFSLESISSWIKKLRIENYLLAVGSINNHVLPDHIIYQPWWSFNIIDRNKHCYREPIIENKSYEFDVLLGARRDQRDYVMANFQVTNLLERSIVTYRDEFTGEGWSEKSLQKETEQILNGSALYFPYVSPNLRSDWEVKIPLTKDVSDQVPWKIYDYTKYSVICETLHNGPFFMTEKTGKVLFCKRVFIVFSTPLFLHNLKLLGFKTFSDVIDESYDNEYDSVRRFQKAFDQVNFLAQQNFLSVIDQLQYVLDHNHKRLLEYKEEISYKKKNMLYNKIKEKTNVDCVF